MSQHWSVGIDGGGTRTRAVLADDAGHIAARALGGPGNYQLVGLDGVVGLVRGLLDELATQCGGLPDAHSVGLALAGAGRRHEQEAIHSRLMDLGSALSIAVVSDARAALEGAHGGREGVIAIAGTGSMVLGKSLSGQEIRAGGLGPLLGDEGSGYRLALEALRAVLRARDGAGQPTALSASLARALHLSDWDEVIGRVYGGDLTRDRIAAAAPELFAAVRAGDVVAAEILEGEARALGRQIAAVAGRLELGPVAAPVACLGGVFAEVGMVWPLLESAATSCGQSIRRVEAQLEPVLGAVLLAHQASGRGRSKALVEGLSACGPIAWDEPATADQ